jgi:3-hydroxyacyl-[acyl-carrier-protein] dehydratase
VSRIREEIRGSIKHLWMNTEAVLLAHLSFSTSFAGFQGHFPGKPILPGICLIQAMLGSYEAYHKIPIRLIELRTAKFVAPVLPEEDIIMECQEMSKQGREVIVRASCKKDDKKIAMLEALVQIVS